MASFLSQPSPLCPAPFHCADRSCPGMVAQSPSTGRWYVTMGHAAFNSRANNDAGYTSAGLARAAVRGRLAGSARRLAQIEGRA